MSSLCITRSISLDSQDGFYSPSIDLGKDFEYLIRKCIAEKMAREQDISDAFGNDQSEATTICEVASLDMPLDFEKENDTNTGVAKTDAESCEEENNNNTKKIPCVTQESNESCNHTEKVPDENSNSEEEQINMTVNEVKKDEEATEITPNAPGRPDDKGESQTPEIEAIFAEFEFPPLVREPYATRERPVDASTSDKSKKTKFKKPKWKPVGKDTVSFKLFLLPRRTEMPLTDCDIIYDMQAELKKFEKELTELKDSETQVNDNANSGTSEVTRDNLKEEILCDRVLFGDILKRESAESINDSYNDYQPTDEEYFEDRVPIKVLERLENFRNNKYACKHLRRKHKWKYQKARKAIKTKHFSTKNIVNKPHGSKLYINHRLRGCNTYYTFCGHFLPTPRGLRRSDIDSKGFIFVEEQGGRKIREYKGNCGIGNARNNYAAPVRNYPVAQPVPAYALRANNADGALENDLVNILINLQNRDLTPEDYELLLRLDERVAPKTVNQDILDTFKTDLVSETELGGGCSVCMEAYQLGQERKHLPCGHIFHKNCIETWLKNSSLNCPLDGLSVELE